MAAEGRSQNNKKTKFEVEGILLTTSSFKTEDKKFKETLQKICMEHQILTREDFTFPYSRTTTFFKLETYHSTLDEKNNPTTIESLLQCPVKIKGTIFQYDFVNGNGKKLVGVSVKVNFLAKTKNSQK